MESLLGITGLTPGGLGIWGILFYLVAWSLKEWRETRKLSSEDRQARREGFQAQAESLMNENRKLREEVHNANANLDDYRKICQIETDQLRALVRTYRDQVEGYKRALLQYVDTIPEFVSSATGVPLSQLKLPPRPRVGEDKKEQK